MPILIRTVAASPTTFEEWVEHYKTKPDAEVEYDKDFSTGFQLKAAMAVFSERKKEREDARQKREEEHNLQTYWRLANWGERFGMMSLAVLVFTAGVLCARIHFISSAIDLIRSVKP
jgi:uncharacterized protein (UPF0335 family)